MCTQSVKTKITNNIIVEMSNYLDADTVQILEKVIIDELINVNVETINTLPVEYKEGALQKNEYIIKLFLIKKRNLKRKTQEAYLGSVKRLLTAIEHKALDQMDENDIEWYLNIYERRNLSSNGKLNTATSVNNERRFLSAFFSWMRKAKLISSNPVESTEPIKTSKKPIDYYTDEEMAKLKDACKNIRERAILEVFRSTGARVGEIAEIRMDQVDLNTGDICIEGEKGGRYRTLYLDSDARHYYRLYLESRKEECQYMLSQIRTPDEKLSTCAYRGIFRALGKRAGLKTKSYPHKFRKTLGMNLKNKAVDIGTIQEILGHVSPAVTAMYYAQSTPETLRGVRARAA